MEEQYRKIPKKNGSKSFSRSSNIISQMGKLPPQAVDIEELVLGAIMQFNQCMVEVVGILKPECFYKDAHQEIFRACMNLFHDNKAIDIATVSNRLRSDGKLELIGGAYYVTQLTSRVSSPAHTSQHCQILLQKFASREIIRISSEATRSAFEDDGGENVPELLNKISEDLDQLQEIVNGKQISSDIRDVVTEVITQLRKPLTTALPGIPTGCKMLDQITGGWQKSDLNYMIARPGMGKTSWVLEAIKTACEAGHRVAVFSLEMPEKQLINRMLSNMTEINHKAIKHRSLDTEKMDALWTAGEKIKSWKLYVNDQSRINPTMMRTAVRLQQHKWGAPVEMIVIDYLQMISVSEHKRFNTRDQEVQWISAEVKAMAKDFDCPVICVSTMSRKCEERSDKRPEMSDARDSGSIESDADMLLSLYRSCQYYNGPDADRGEHYQQMDINQWERCAELTILKNRHGDTATMLQEFYGEYYQFRELKLDQQHL